METTGIPDLPECPKCGIEFAMRVPRGEFVKAFLFWLPLKRYKCMSCLKSTYVLSFKEDSIGITPEPGYRTMRIAEEAPKTLYISSSSNTGQ
jgi:hypothetical protein